MNAASQALPVLKADLLLVHAPAIFDFRNRRDLYFPFLGTSGDVPITPLYEYFPVGFRSLQRYLGERDHDVKIINLSTLLLCYPDLELATIARALDVPIVGIDLHWMVHVQGSLAVAEQIKRERPDIQILFGGISSTYYADQLIRYPFIDMVMRGYDTHVPVDGLLRARRHEPALREVPNLLWKDDAGRVVDNGYIHKPDMMACGIDWRTAPRAPVSKGSFAIREYLSVQNAGCAYNCGWCGGSREAFRRINHRKNTMIRKPIDQVRYEFDSLRSMPATDNYHFYSVGAYNETKAGLENLISGVHDSGLKSVSYEQFHLTPPATLKRMAEANKNTIITLSPESHDLRVSKLAGRGTYTNEELEAWLGDALDAGISQIDIWYFIGMPEQDEASVRGTVEYCAHLLHKFKGARVNPMICPMIPFLDPASTFFEEPEHGFQVFFRTVEEHRRGMMNASLINRMNYETRWLSRRQLVDVGFNAVRELMQIKAQTGMLPQPVVDHHNALVEDALMFLPVVHEADSLSDPEDRRRALDGLGAEILRRNQQIITPRVSNQGFPLQRTIVGRWFDEFGWQPEALDAIATRAA